MQTNCGIYLITCRPPGLLPIYYVGQSQNVSLRIRQHISALRNCRHHNSRLQACWSKYGASTFTFEFIEDAPIDRLDEFEAWWISEMIGYSRVCNIGTDPAAPMRGLRFSASHRAKISEATRGTRHYLFGKNATAEHRKAISLGGAGLIRATATRRKISAATTGASNPMFGRSGAASARSKAVLSTCPVSGATRVYESACLAEADGFRQESISRCCNGTQRLHGGLSWSFVTT